MGVRRKPTMNAVARAVGTAGATASALMAVLAFVFVPVGHFSELNYPAVVLVVGLLATIAALAGCRAWWQRRWMIAAIGMWCAACISIVWWSLVLLPICMAIIATTLAIRVRGMVSA